MVALWACLVISTVWAQGAGPDGSAPAPPPVRPPRAQGLQRDADLVLVGVVVREGAVPFAIIEDRRAKRQGLYKVGALVRGARIVKILDDKVVLAFADGEVELRLASGRGEEATAPPAPSTPVVVVLEPQTGASGIDPVPSPPSRPSLERSMLEQSLDGADMVMDVMPLDDGGVRVQQVRRSTLFETLGLRKGDVIRSVNGRFPGPALPLSKAMESVLETGHLRLEVERNGRTEVTYIQIQP